MRPRLAVTISQTFIRFDGPFLCQGKALSHNFPVRTGWRSRRESPWKCENTHMRVVFKRVSLSRLSTLSLLQFTHLAIEVFLLGLPKTTLRLSDSVERLPELCVFFYSYDLLQSSDTERNHLRGKTYMWSLEDTTRFHKSSPWAGTEHALHSCSEELWWHTWNIAFLGSSLHSVPGLYGGHPLLQDTQIFSPNRRTGVSINHVAYPKSLSSVSTVICSGNVENPLKIQVHGAPVKGEPCKQAFLRRAFSGLLYSLPCPVFLPVCGSCCAVCSE